MKSLNNAEAKDQPFSPAAVIVTLRNLAATISTLAASFLKKKKNKSYLFMAAYWLSLVEVSMGFSLCYF